MGTVFKFKQFEVDQRDCAMKINTDGVLLGALASFDQPRRILDLGSGTGVISLMLAQRFAEALVDAVEIDEAAYLRTKDNFSQSIFSSRLCAYHSSFEAIESVVDYDLIVSNPPFYTDSLHNPDAKKKLARHTDHAFFLQVLSFAFVRLADHGALQLILPTELAVEIVKMATDIGFALKRTIDIHSFVHTASIRQIIDLRKEDKGSVKEEHFVIYKEKGEYSASYKSLLAPFFLAY